MAKTKELARAFNGRDVRVVVRDGVEWFVAKDVCDILGLDNVSQALVDFPEGEKSNITTNDLRETGIEAGNRGLTAINEPGLYRLIFKSRKPEAEAFKTWVFEEVLPSIRKTGKYDVRDIREKSTMHRNMVTAQWQRQGVNTPAEYALLTREEYLRLYGDAEKKKGAMSKQEMLKLSAFEAVESWKLSEVASLTLGFSGCRGSIQETARVLDEVKKTACLEASA